MNRQVPACICLLVASLSLSFASNGAYGITGYGVDANFTLFHFDVDNPNPTPVTVDGNIGFVPEGIDFRPSSNVLYAIDIGPVNTQLYTINIANGASTPVGPGFPSAVAGSYDLTVNSRFGFDFNPTTLQGDGSMRIRLVSTAGVNMRINSQTGLVAGVDTPLLIPPSQSPFVDAIAYTNNLANSGGSTQLFDLDTRNDSMYHQTVPNDGMLTQVGTGFGLGDDVIAPSHFDIYTTPGDVDPTPGGDRGLAVFRRPAAPVGGVSPLNSYLLYDISFATGVPSMGRVVGVPATPANFDGGFAVLPGVPEPSTVALAALAAIGVIGLRRRK